MQCPSCPNNQLGAICRQSKSTLSELERVTPIIDYEMYLFNLCLGSRFALEYSTDAVETNYITHSWGCQLQIRVKRNKCNSKRYKFNATFRATVVMYVFNAVFQCPGQR
eukprot:3317829-Amphidinium_carterae.1